MKLNVRFTGHSWISPTYVGIVLVTYGSVPLLWEIVDFIDIDKLCPRNSPTTVGKNVLQHKNVKELHSIILISE